jgi:nitroreductase
MQMTITAPPPTLDDLLHARHSCRAFRPDPVDRGTMETLLALAQRAPSWCNTQPWHAYVTEGAATDRFRDGLLDAIATEGLGPDVAFPERYEGDAKIRRRACAKRLYSSVGIADGDREASARQTMENFKLFGAPHVAVITTERHLGTYGAVDCGVYIGTFVLAAQSLGLATIPQAAIAVASPFVRTFLDLPQDRQVLCGISFGYPDPEHPANSFRTDRADIDQAATFLTS